MSAFITSPYGLHLDTCQNLIKTSGQWDYCPQPVIGLGREHNERDICQTCRARSTAYGKSLAARWSADMSAEGRAVLAERTREILADMDAAYAARAAASAPMAELYVRRCEIDKRAAVLAAIAGEEEA